MEPISFNEPYLTGKESDLIKECLKRKQLSGNGHFTLLVREFFQRRFGFKNNYLTTSCSDALEMTSILSELSPGDEVIVPSYTFVSTANAFVLRGAKIIFADSLTDHPNIDVSALEELITSKTKAICVMHYGGVACDMDPLMLLAKKYKLIVIEDAAQSIMSYYKNRFLGTIGHFSTFSFHETKNLSSGEGGLLVVNNDKYNSRADIIWQKGTNRSAFNRGEVDKYTWVDIGSSYLPSEIIAAFLYAQLTELEHIQEKRKVIWERYHNGLLPLRKKGAITFLEIPKFATNNAHLFAMVCKSQKERDALISFLKSKEINAVFHYQSLHSSPYFVNKHDGRVLGNSDRFSQCLVRLPLHLGLSYDDIDRVIDSIMQYYEKA